MILGFECYIESTSYGLILDEYRLDTLDRQYMFLYNIYCIYINLYSTMLF